MNFFDITVKRDGDNLIAAFADGQNISLKLKDMRTVREDILDGNEHKVIMGARGESIDIGADGLAVNVSIKEILGENTHLFVRLGDAEYIVCLNDRVEYSTGEEVRLAFNEKKLHLFDPESGESLLGREYENAVKGDAAEKTHGEKVPTDEKPAKKRAAKAKTAAAKE